MSDSIDPRVLATQLLAAHGPIAAPTEAMIRGAAANAVGDFAALHRWEEALRLLMMQSWIDQSLPQASRCAAPSAPAGANRGR